MTRDERQEIVAQKWFKEANGRGIFVGKTGFGKTRIALIIISRLLSKKSDLKIVILVPNIDLVKQWKDILKKEEISKKSCEVRTIASLKRELVDADFLIIDELHTALSEKNLINILKCKFQFFLGLTATINRIDKHEEYLIKHFPIFDEVTKEECIKNNWSAPNIIYKVEIETDLKEYYIINEQYNHHFSFFQYNFDIVNRLLKAGFNSNYARNLAYYMKRPVNEVFGHATSTMRLINERKTWIYNHPIKHAIVDQIIKARLDSKIITFSQSQQIAESLPYGKVVHSGINANKRKAILDEFHDMKTGVIHSVKGLVAGYDCPNLNVGIATSFNSSRINQTQSTGRVERVEGDKRSEFFNLVLKDTIEEKWFESSHVGVEYFVINEKELVDILNRKKIRLSNEDEDYSYLI